MEHTHITYNIRLTTHSMSFHVYDVVHSTQHVTYTMCYVPYTCTVLRQVFICICFYVYLCMCMQVCIYNHVHIYICVYHYHYLCVCIYICMYTYIYMCVCVRVSSMQLPGCGYCLEMGPGNTCCVPSCWVSR